MGPTWGRQDPDGPHVGPMNLAIRISKDSKGDLKKNVFNLVSIIVPANGLAPSKSILVFMWERHLTHLFLDNTAAMNLADGNFTCIFLNGSDRTPIRISLKFVPKCLIVNKPALV